MPDFLAARNFELQTQTSNFVLANEPYATSLDYELPSPVKVAGTIKDAGIFANRGGSANAFSLIVLYNPLGLPTTEVTRSQDTGVETVTSWQYSGDERREIFRNGSETISKVMRRVMQPSGNILYSFDDDTRLVEKTSSAADGTSVRVLDGHGHVSAEYAYDTNGLLQKSVREGTTTLFSFDEHGRLIQLEADRSCLTIGGVAQPAIWEFHHSATSVKVHGQDGGVTTFQEERTYDEQKRPVIIETTSGAYDLNATHISQRIKYAV